MPEKSVVILNPKAGSAVEPGLLSQQLSFLPGLSIEVTEKAGDAQRLAEQAAHAGASLVVAAGGDGTLHEVVNGLAPHFEACRLGIIPAGTGNDTARSLGIPLDVREAIELLRAGECRPVDVIRIRQNDHVCYALNAATGGFGGAVNEAMTGDVRDFWGSLAYVRAAAEVLPIPPAYDVTVEVDGGETQAHRVISLVVANGAFAARGVNVAPGAAIDDGALSVQIVLESNAADLLAIATSILEGERPDHPKYLAFSCQNVLAVCENGLPMSVDGELRTMRDAAFEILPAALRVICR
jgi:diacylglycerol kinase (ATP)